MNAEEPLAHTLLDCPRCGLPAEVIDRFTFDGSPQPVEHVELTCVVGHRFSSPVDSLPHFRQAHPPTTADDGKTDAGTIRTRRVHRLMARLQVVWDELGYAQRRMLEIQTGVPWTEER